MSDFSLSFDGKNGETIRVDAEVSMAYPEQCVFKVNQPLYPGHAAHFASAEQSMGSPLIDELFELDFVNDVLVSDDTLTVNLKSGSWEENVPGVGAAINRVIDSGKPAISEEVTRNLPSAEETRERVEKILDEMINPAVASHGGAVTLLDVKENNVFLEFSGGCHGCGMAKVTLKYGVERAIRENVAGVGEILDTTDHASGRNPYYNHSHTE
jgi:Fe-S cluster biogenesis protein NfuA